MNKIHKIENFISNIRNSHPDMMNIFLFGSCLNFHFILKSVFPEAIPYYNIDHIITKIDNNFYDITGNVNKIAKGYVPYYTVYNKKTLARATKQMLSYYYRKNKMNKKEAENYKRYLSMLKPPPQEYHDMIAKEVKDSFTTQEVCEVVGISKQTVSRRSSKNKIFAIKIRNRYFYPKWQFKEDGTTLEGLKEALDYILSSDFSNVICLGILTARRDFLSGKSIKECLLLGEIEAAMMVAAMHASETFLRENCPYKNRTA